MSQRGWMRMGQVYPVRYGGVQRRSRRVALARPAMEFRVLGPLEASDGQRPLRLGGQRKRALLARLLLEANRTVSVDALVDDLWGEHVPATAVKMVQIDVSQLRKVLPSGGAADAPAGLRARGRARGRRLDPLRAAAQGGAARRSPTATPSTAAERSARRWALWRGPALGEFTEPFAAAAAAHLEELRLRRRRGPGRGGARARPPRDVDRRSCEALVGEPSAARARSPASSCSRCTARAGTPRRSRPTRSCAPAARDELGLDPSAALAELQYRILNQDPGLDAGAPAAPRAARARAGPGAGLVGRDGGARAARGGARRSGGRARRDRARRRPRRHRQDAARPASWRSGRAGAARPCSRDGASTWSAPPCPTSRSSRRSGRCAGAAPSTGCRSCRGCCPARRAPRPRTARARVAAAPVRGGAHGARASRRRPRRSCSCSRTCTGPTARRSTSSRSWRTPRRCSRVLILATWRQDAVRRDDPLQRLASGLRRRPAGASRWSSGRSRRTSSLRSLARERRRAAGPERSSRSAPRRGQPVLRRAS